MDRRTIEPFSDDIARPIDSPLTEQLGNRLAVFNDIAQTTAVVEVSYVAGNSHVMKNCRGEIAGSDGAFRDLVRASAHYVVLPQRTSRRKLSFQPQLRLFMVTLCLPGRCFRIESVKRLRQA